MKLFSGSANPQLSNEVSKLLKIPLSKVEIIRFGNSEVKVTIQEDVKNKECVIIQPTSNPTDTHLMELLFFCDALQRQEAKHITAIIPYFGYAKQNIAHRKGECVSANVVIRMIEAVGFHQVIAFDLHDEATAGVFSIPFTNTSVFPLLAKQSYKYLKSLNIDEKEVVLISPDQGAVEKVRNFGKYFFNKDNFSEAVIEKFRDQNVMHKAKPIGFYGEVKGKIALIVDDMVVSGSTLLPAIDLCLSKGAKAVYAAIVHHDFTIDASDKIQNSPLIKFITTNTIALRPEQKFEKLEEISVSKIISQIINTI
jgi:ribose-phosphate pyrophosphokinase